MHYGKSSLEVTSEQRFCKEIRRQKWSGGRSKVAEGRVVEKQREGSRKGG
jgi:hypothetical protein